MNTVYYYNIKNKTVFLIIKQCGKRGNAIMNILLLIANKLTTQKNDQGHNLSSKHQVIK